MVKSSAAACCCCGVEVEAAADERRRTLATEQARVFHSEARGPAQEHTLKAKLGSRLMSTRCRAACPAGAGLARASLEPDETRE